MSPTPKLLIVDNRDSFTWNIAQLASSLGAKVDVVNNDEISGDIVRKEGYSHLVIGPGPMGPQESQKSLDIINEFSGVLPLLGICLGMQAMVLLDGGTIYPHDLLHGGQDMVIHTGSGVHEAIESPFRAARYNSLSVKMSELSAFSVTAKNSAGTVMAIRHKTHQFTEGVQYHPESFMTPVGSEIMETFLSYSYENNEN
ncbi:aminodeoxychorismate/anthranilate synthase component II [bacterium]|nr:aminodeoxychorismate/anthranilate synthase component II [bacterium]